MKKTAIAFLFLLFYGVADGATIGERFHEETKLTWFRALMDTLTPNPHIPHSRNTRGKR